MSGQCVFFSISISQGGGGMCPTCASTPPSIHLCPVSDNPPIALSLLFLPLCAVCLTFFTYLSHFLCSHSVRFPFPPLSSQSAAQTPLSHPFSPFIHSIHSSVATDVNHATALSESHWCHSLPVVMPQIKCCNVALITSHPLSLINTKALC